MAFRGDIEAERERVAALERDVEAARARRNQDQARIAELHRLTTERHSRLPQPPPVPMGRAKRIFLTTVLAVIMIGGALARMAPKPRSHYWILRAEISLKEQLKPDEEVLVFEADSVEPSGEVQINSNAGMRVRTRHPDARCEIIEWADWEPELNLRRYPFSCMNDKPHPLHCTLAQVRERAHVVADSARVRFQGGSWRIDRDGADVTIADDCPGTWWGHE